MRQTFRGPGFDWKESFLKKGHSQVYCIERSQAGR